VFQQLTNYLLQYKRVSIPSVGTIHLVQQPAQLKVADKVLLPPAFSAELQSEDTVPEHQLDYLSAALNQGKENVRQSLEKVGRWLVERMDGEGFHWKGIGLIRNNAIQSSVSLPAMEAIPAERVLRRNAEHNVLVGDQQMTSRQITERNVDGVVERKRSIVDIVGWIVLLVAILYILFVLYQGKFRVGATGSKQSPTSSLQLKSSFGKNLNLHSASML